MERETLEVDVLVVGAGPAGLSFATEFARRCKDRGEEKSILVLDKAEELGHHQLSGAVVDPRGILEVWPHAESDGFPIQAKVSEDAFWWMRSGGKRKFQGPFLPPPFKNKGKWIVSMSEAVQWMATQAEAAGVEVYAGFAGAEVLYGGNEEVVGVRTVDQGRGKSGEQKGNYQPGYDIKAALTVFAEGARGNLAKTLMAKKNLMDGRNAQIWGMGVKEIWEVEHSLEGQVIHTGGWPLDTSIYGGGWVYGLPGNRLSIGFVIGMDHGNASLDYHACMQQWKTHPAISELLEGGKIVKFGAKCVPEGGLFSIPRLWGDGFLLVGDTAGFMNAQRLKGVHLAVKSGALAAEAADSAFADSAPTGAALSCIDTLFQASWAYQELHKVRNFRQAFQRGFLYGFLRAGIDTVFGGRLPGRLPTQSDHERYYSVPKSPQGPSAAQNGPLTFDKLSSVFHSSSMHEEDQPCHLVVPDPSICTDRCTEEFGNPCQHFCPASVYEWQDNQLLMNPSNCVHCKTCDIADPYENIDWVVPESGGPVYTGM